jgi:hypothetical protein
VRPLGETPHPTQSAIGAIATGDELGMVRRQERRRRDVAGLAATGYGWTRICAATLIDRGRERARVLGDALAPRACVAVERNRQRGREQESANDAEYSRPPRRRTPVCGCCRSGTTRMPCRPRG